MFEHGIKNIICNTTFFPVHRYIHKTRTIPLHKKKKKKKYLSLCQTFADCIAGDTFFDNSFVASAFSPNNNLINL